MRVVNERRTATERLELSYTEYRALRDFVHSIRNMYHDYKNLFDEGMDYINKNDLIETITNIIHNAKIIED